MQRSLTQSPGKVASLRAITSVSILLLADRVNLTCFIFRNGGCARSRSVVANGVSNLLFSSSPPFVKETTMFEETRWRITR